MIYNEGDWLDGITAKEALRIIELLSQVTDKLGEISKLYKDGVKWTVVIRAVDQPDSNGRYDTILTDDEPRQVIEAIKWLIP